MWLPDATGPDGIRVTVRVEPAVARWTRTYYRWTVPPFLLIALDRVRRRLLRAIQTGPLDGRWAVDVESDSGLKVRLTRPTRDEATALAAQVVADVTAQGELAINAYRS